MAGLSPRDLLAHHNAQEGDGSGRTIPRSDDLGSDAVPDAKRQRTEAATAGNEHCSIGGRDCQVAGNAMEGAVMPCSLRHLSTHHPSHHFLHAHTCSSYHTGGAGQPTGAGESLRRLARRILQFPDGTFEPSAAPALLQKLTDELLVVASDAVSTVVAEAASKPSARAVLKLLAWTVADARGASIPLDESLALTVGKRLDRQASKVRDALAAVSADADVERAEARAAAAADEALAAALPARLAAIDAKVQAAYTAAREEVYVGFHELEALIPRPPPDAPPPPQSPDNPELCWRTPAEIATDLGVRPADLNGKRWLQMSGTGGSTVRGYACMECAPVVPFCDCRRRTLERQHAIIQMLQRALSQADRSLHEMAQLASETADTDYLEDMFRRRSFIDQGEWERARDMYRADVRRLVTHIEDEVPYHDLSEENMDELWERSKDPIRNFSAWNLLPGLPPKGLQM